MNKPRYALKVDCHEQVAVDPGSHEALFALIEQRTGIQRIAAENLLDTGKLIVAGELIVCREDYLEAAWGEFHSASKDTEPGSQDQPTT